MAKLTNPRVGYNAWDINSNDQVGDKLRGGQRYNFIKNILQAPMPDMSQSSNTLKPGINNTLTKNFGLAPGTAINTFSMQQIVPMIAKYYGQNAADVFQAKIDASIKADKDATGRTWEGFSHQVLEHGNDRQTLNALNNKYNATGVWNPQPVNLGPPPQQYPANFGQPQQPVNVPQSAAPQVNTDQNALVAQFLQGRAAGNIPMIDAAVQGRQAPAGNK